MQAVQRIREKGEASATTRKKRENKDLIRSDGIWGWDNEKLWLEINILDIELLTVFLYDKFLFTNSSLVYVR